MAGETAGGRVRAILKLADQVKRVLVYISSQYHGEAPLITGFTVAKTEFAGSDSEERLILIFSDKGSVYIATEQNSQSCCGNSIYDKYKLSVTIIGQHGMDSPLFNIASIRTALREALTSKANEISNVVIRIASA